MSPVQIKSAGMRRRRRRGGTGSLCTSLIFALKSFCNKIFAPSLIWAHTGHAALTFRQNTVNPESITCHRPPGALNRLQCVQGGGPHIWHPEVHNKGPIHPLGCVVISCILKAISLCFPPLKQTFPARSNPPRTAQFALVLVATFSFTVLQ